METVNRRGGGKQVNPARFSFTGSHFLNTHQNDNWSPTDRAPKDLSAKLLAGGGVGVGVCYRVVVLLLGR